MIITISVIAPPPPPEKKKQKTTYPTYKLLQNLAKDKWHKNNITTKKFRMYIKSGNLQTLKHKIR